MKSRFNVAVVLTAAALALGTGPVFAAAKRKPEVKPSPTPAAMPAMDAAMQAQMQKAMQMAQPGPNQETLKGLEGKWDAAFRGWMKPGDTPMESTGTEENAMVFGGRYLKQDFKGTWNGQPFEGMGFTGYDNMRQEFESVWMDSMSTGIMMSTGSWDASTKTIKTAGTFSCPMTNETNRWFRTEWTINDADTNTYSMYSLGPDGKEFKSMEILYKRAK